jgi:hypothetical protein
VSGFGYMTGASMRRVTGNWVRARRQTMAQWPAFTSSALLSEGVSHKAPSSTSGEDDIASKRQIFFESA